MHFTDCNGDPLLQDVPVSGKVKMGNINLSPCLLSLVPSHTRHLTCPSSPSLDSYHHSCTHPPAFASEVPLSSQHPPESAVLTLHQFDQTFPSFIVSRSKTVSGLALLIKGVPLPGLGDSCALVLPPARTKELESFTDCPVTLSTAPCRLHTHNVAECNSNRAPSQLDSCLC